MAASGQPNSPEMRERARDMLITRELINQEAINRGLITSEAVQEQLEQARLNVLVGALLS